ncbi:hypothetical protein Tco_1452964 [Tanacetum coccineum]
MLERSTGIAGVTKATSGPEAITKEQQSPRKVRSISLLMRRLVHNQYLEHGDNLDSEDQLRAEGDALISKGSAIESHL